MSKLDKRKLSIYQNIIAGMLIHEEKLSKEKVEWPKSEVRKGIFLIFLFRGKTPDVNINS